MRWLKQLFSGLRIIVDRRNAGVKTPDRYSTIDYIEQNDWILISVAGYRLISEVNYANGWSTEGRRYDFEGQLSLARTAFWQKNK